MFDWLNTYRSRTIARDITLGLVLTIFVVTVAVAVVSYALILRGIRENLAAEARDSTARLASVLAGPMWNVDGQAIAQSAEAFLQTADIVAIRIWNESDTLIYDQNRADVGPELLLVEERPIFFGQRPIGRVEASYTLIRLQDASGYLIGTTTAILLLVLAAVVIVTQLLLRQYLTKPLGNLGRGLDTIASGNYAYRIPTAAQTDVAQLGQHANAMAAQIEARDNQLQQLVQTLEQRVAARTARLETVAVVGGYLSGFLSVEALLRELVAQIKQRFHYYQVFVFLLEKEQGVLRIAAGTEAAEGHLLPSDLTIPLEAPVSLVARTARTKEVVLVNNVNQASDWLAHRLVPKTKAELAVPILLNGEAVGVLDVQQDQENGFDEGDANLLRSLASQVAIAMRNAQLYEAAVAARQQAEHLSEIKTQFLSNMSHELRTPLNAIINFTGFVMDGLMGETTPEQQEALHYTLDNGHHLLGLVNDILDISKMEAGFMSLIFEEVQLAQVLTSVVSTAQGLAQGKPVVVRSHIPADLPVVVGDERRLRQVFLNLVSNAVKYTSQGEVVVTAEYDSAAQHIQVEVRDSGVGIAPEDFERIFQPFQQAKHSLGSVNSTGLGLPITKQLLALHGGRIWFESERGRGSTFYATVPLLAAGSDGLVKLEPAPL